MTQHYTLRSFLLVTMTTLFVFSFWVAGVFAQSFSSVVPLEGYAWSSNIGWISMNGTNYGVQINLDKSVTGYAWSSNIGWIQFGGFSAADIPSGGEHKNNARVVGMPGNWSFQGWARALSNGGGWDGWISLSGVASNGSSYGVDFDNNGNMLTNSQSPYAWGSDVVGWTLFSLVYMTPPCGVAPSCLANNSGYQTTNIWCDANIPTSCTSSSICIDSSPGCTEIRGNLDVSQNLVRKGNVVMFSWSGVTLPVTQCRVEGNDGYEFIGGQSNAGVNSYPVTFNQTMYTLYCTPVGGAEVELDSVTVSVVPEIYEN